MSSSERHNPMILTSVFAGLAALWGGGPLADQQEGRHLAQLAERGALVIIVFSVA